MTTQKPTPKGLIDLYGLSDWWLTTFTDDERLLIDERYQPIGAISNTLTQGEFGKGRTGRASQLLWGLATWFRSREEFDIARRILEKALDVAEDPLDQHFTYQGLIRTYYPQRDAHPEALEEAINACQKQIEIAPIVAARMRSEYSDSPLPRHVGYEQLGIILDKQGQYSDAVELSRQAQEQGWKGDWDKRITKYEKKASRSKEQK